VKPKAIVMVGGGIQEVPAVKQVQDMGYECIVTDRNPRAPAFRDADYTWNYNGLGFSQIIAEARHAMQYDNLEIAGVFTLTELFVSVSHIAQELGLVGASVESSKTCQHKIRAKQRWLNLGIPTARGCEVETEKEALELFHFFNNDSFLKPDVGFGAQGCKRVITEDELLTQFWYIKKNTPVLMEEYLTNAIGGGAVHDVNAVFTKDGGFYPLSISDRKFDGTQEIEASCPTSLQEFEVSKIYKLTEDAARALGIDRGPVKADVMGIRASNGWNHFYIMEMATRLHGPMGTLHLIPESLGFRPLDAMICALTGEDVDVPVRGQTFEKPMVATRNHDATITVKEN